VTCVSALKLNSIQKANTTVFEYIDIIEYRKRWHASPGYWPPQKMETWLLNKKLAA
jgi:hypothetical protein